MRVHDHEVAGVGVDAETRCAHYDGARDVVAIRFACCGRYFACYRCHRAVADHPATVWPREAFDRAAILCGVCGTELSVEAYLGCNHQCSDCGAGFNPGCANHRHRYFET